MDKYFDLKGKTAVITGGTGGLGSAVCKGLAEAGVNLAVADISEERLKETAALISPFGNKVITAKTDVTDPQSLGQFVDQAVNELGKIDILINCAGITIKKPILEQTLDEWNKVVSVNLTAVFLGGKLVVPHMIKTGGGKIINFCSMGSYVSIKTSGAYCAAKGGLLQLTKVMAMEWAPYNIQVNAVAPGFFNTAIASGIKNNPESYNKLMIKSPMKRLAEVDELVGTILYLASPATNFVTGVCIPIDGGFLADGI
jgi:2-deoxy-D-gluconate 3-dehydrogenase